MNRHIFRTRLFTLLVMFYVLTGCAQVTATAQIPTPNPSPTSIPPTIELPSSTPEPTSTPANTDSVWEIKENWSAANQVRAMLIAQNGDLWTGGPAGVVHWDLKTNTPTVYALQSDSNNTNVVGLSQTPDGAIWVGTYGNGLARFTGTSWQSFTVNNGLAGNYIISQMASSSGEFWISTKKERQGDQSDNFALEWYDGNKWIKEKTVGFSWIYPLPDNSMVVATGEKEPLFHDGVYIYDRQILKDLVYDDREYNSLRGKSIKNITVAQDGLIWAIVTRSSPFARIIGYDFDAIYQYGEKKAWVEVTPIWKGKDDAWVSSIATSSNGEAWFGTSYGTGQFIDACGDRYNITDELGVYHYKNSFWQHFTTEDGLIDNKICAITIDQNNNVWFGSFDKGVSRFDGKAWTSYIVP